MNTFEVLDRPIAFQRAFVRITGSINAALMLSQAVYWSRRTSLEDGWFWKTQGEWEDETGLTRRQQDTAREALRELGLLEEKRSGVPCKVFFRLDEQRLRELCTKTLSSVCPKEPDWIARNRTNSDGENRQTNTETTQRLHRESSPKDKPSEEPSKHSLFRAAFDNYFQKMNGLAAPWDAKEATNLARWLKKNPSITVDQWNDILINRTTSQVNNALELSAWINRALTWLTRSANDFGQGKDSNHGGTGKISQNGENLRAALSRLNDDHGRPSADGLLPGSGSTARLPHRVLQATSARASSRSAGVTNQAR